MLGSNQRPWDQKTQCAVQDPAFAAGIAYARDCNGTHALDAQTGAIRWFDHGATGCGGPHTLANGVLYCDSEGSVVAVDGGVRHGGRPRRPGTGSGSSGRRRSLLAGNLGGKTRASSGWAFEAEAPAERLDPIGEADESRAGAGLGASNAIVADDDGGDAM